ncbi:hypothetical protein [Flavobacterium sp. XGLA_31]|uniref:hypothetical protein n=1 Tax=Flavobacterium sp. XGLA_31 TaxID=3447666 RepID=UPI003F31E78D
MARQKGILKIKGTIGDITFYKTKDGYLVKEKSAIEGNRIATDPAFQRTRENNYEFGRAGKAGKVLRTALRPLLLNTSDSRMVGRLTQMMMKVIKADLVSDRGQRNVIDGETELLVGFEFNSNGKLSNSLYAPFTSNIDRVSGDVILEIPPFVPIEMVAAPSGTTHFKIVSGGAELDFEAGTFVVSTSETVVLPWDATPTVLVTHTNVVTPNSTKPILMVVGVEFYQEVNGSMYPLKNGAYNPLSVVIVDSGV